MHFQLGGKSLNTFIFEHVKTRQYYIYICLLVSKIKYANLYYNTLNKFSFRLVK
jgi:hypothetical protein